MVDNSVSGSPSNNGVSSTPLREDQGAHVGQSALHAGAEMVDSVKEQGKAVAAETGRQARGLYQQVTAEVGEQAGAQQRRAVDGLYALGDEVAKMADQGTSGPATEVARQAADRINQAAHWLERREPGHILDEVKDFARRRPAVFFVGAAVLGVLAGRLTKNLAAGTDSDGGLVQGRGLAARSEPTPYSTGVAFAPVSTQVPPPGPQAADLSAAVAGPSDTGYANEVRR